MGAELPEKRTCRALKGHQDVYQWHVVVAGSVLRNRELCVTYLWPTGESATAPLRKFHELYEPCTNPRHPGGAAHV